MLAHSNVTPHGTHVRFPTSPCVRVRAVSKAQEAAVETRSGENGDGEGKGYDDVSVIAERVRLGGHGIYFLFGNSCWVLPSMVWGMKL